MPQPVYAQGADLNTGDCIRVVQNLVASVCAAADNCRGMSLSDVRPAIMVRLAQLPGHNYASSCAGYIDDAFATYTAQYDNAVAGATGRVNFPGATAANPNANGAEIKFENPYTVKPKSWNGVAWQQDIADRRAELNELQAQNGANNAGLARESFPTTYNDLSFADRIANETAGLAPWKDADAYYSIKLEDEKTYLQREQETTKLKADIQKAQDLANLTHGEFCAKYPFPGEKDCRDVYCAQNPRAPECYAGAASIDGGDTGGGNPPPSSVVDGQLSAQPFDEEYDV